MPSRLLREGILDSEGVNALTYPAEVFYRRLMSVVDDFGRFDGRPSVLRSRLYPLKVDTVREADISRWIAECEKAGLIALYAVNRAGSPRWIATCEKAGLAVPGDERPYLLFHKLGSPRAKESRFPAPPGDDTQAITPANVGTHPFTDENGCKRPRASVPGSGSGSGASASAKAKAKEDSSEAAKPPPSEPAVMTFPCVGTGPKEWPLTPAKLTEYREAFPGVNVEGELRKAMQWLRDNPRKTKTFAGVPKFLGSWLGRAQDDGRGGSARAAPAASESRPPRAAADVAAAGMV